MGKPAAMSAAKRILLGIELHFYANAFFCFSKPMAAGRTWANTLYRSFLYISSMQSFVFVATPVVQWLFPYLASSKGHRACSAQLGFEICFRSYAWFAPYAVRELGLVWYTFRRGELQNCTHRPKNNNNIGRGHTTLISQGIKLPALVTYSHNY